MKKRIERKRDLIKRLKKGVIGLGLVGVLGVTGVVGTSNVQAAESTRQQSIQSAVVLKSFNPLTDAKFKDTEEFTLNKPSSITMGESETLENVVNRSLDDLDIKVTAKKGSDPNNISLINSSDTVFGNSLNVQALKTGTYYLSIKEKSTGEYPKQKKKSIKRITLNVKKAPTKIVCTKKKIKIKKVIHIKLTISMEKVKHVIVRGL